IRSIAFELCTPALFVFVLLRIPGSTPSTFSLFALWGLKVELALFGEIEKLADLVKCAVPLQVELSNQIGAVIRGQCVRELTGFEHFEIVHSLQQSEALREEQIHGGATLPRFKVAAADRFRVKPSRPLEENRIAKLLLAL